MHITFRTIIACIAAAGVSVAASSKSQKRLTPQRVAELMAPVEAPVVGGYKIEISGLGNGKLAVAKAGEAGQETKFEQIREFRFPTEFDAPQAGTEKEGFPVSPTTPTVFEKINAGWTVRLTAKPQGRLVALSGVAEYVSVELLPGGYGAISGPIYSERGVLITPNRVDQPKCQTTTTHFHVFALPGESYEVAFYRGSQSEKHTIKVTAE